MPERDALRPSPEQIRDFYSVSVPRERDIVKQINTQAGAGEGERRKCLIEAGKGPMSKLDIGPFCYFPFLSPGKFSSR